MAGLNGAVFYTEDGGETWVYQETGTRDPIHRVIANGGSLYAVGSNGLILRCQSCIDDESGSGNWQAVDHDLPIRFYLRGAALVGDKLWVAGGSGALHSVNMSGQQTNNRTAAIGGWK